MLITSIAFRIGKSAACKVAYFSMHENNHIVKSHCRKGGIACIMKTAFRDIQKRRLEGYAYNDQPDPGYICGTVTL